MVSRFVFSSLEEAAYFPKERHQKVCWILYYQPDSFFIWNNFFILGSGDYRIRISSTSSILITMNL